MLENNRMLLKIFAARLENCTKYLLLDSARETLKTKLLGSCFMPKPNLYCTNFY